MTRVAEKPLRVHLALIAAEAICASAFVVELMRAESGNTLSWAYVFEWPILGAYAVYVWRKLLREGPDEPPPPATADESAALERYNRYLGEVHRDDLRGATDE
ncbi:MAG TPA: hypothetical protein VGS61_08045 [Acidimicrobiales bacterium]|nr:hypothetical protein [Acidimicrobiales bacterium]